MPGPILFDPTPDWLKPQNRSVFDSPGERLLQTLAHLIGADDPQSQVVSMMNPMETGPNGGLVGAAQKFIKAYHGSPHDFDQFSTAKIGTGEGAQAYGHGLYFAEHPDVSRGYRDAVSVAGRAAGEPLDTNMRVGRQRVEDLYHQLDLQAARMPIKDAQRIYDRMSALEGLMQHGDVLAVREMGTSGQVTPEAMAWFEKEITPTFTRQGKLYEVAIHADPEQFLDWDAPLNQQSEHVRQAIGPDLHRDEFTAAAGKRLVDYSGDTLLGIKLQGELRKNGGNIQQALDSLSTTGNDRWKQLIENARKLDWSDLQVQSVEAPGTGQNLIGDLQRKHTPAGVNEYLKSKGIPGIKYLDQGSRATGEGTRNYVVFDDALVEIRRKYGWLPPAIATMLAKDLMQQRNGEAR